MKLTKVNDGQTAPPEDMTFEEWALAKYREVRDLSKFVEQSAGNVDPVELNGMLARFTDNFSWAVTMAELESNKHRQMEAEFQAHRRKCYSKARTRAKEEVAGTREPTIATIEGVMESRFGEELSEFEKRVIDQKSRAELLRALVKVLDKHASVLQTLSSNMRSEMYYSGGVPISQGGEPVVRGGSVSSAKDQLARMGSGLTSQEPTNQ